METIFSYLPPNVNVAIAVILGAWCVYASARASCSIARVGMATLGAAALVGAGFIYGVSTTLAGCFQ